MTEIAVIDSHVIGPESSRLVAEGLSTYSVPRGN